MQLHVGLLEDQTLYLCHTWATQFRFAWLTEDSTKPPCGPSGGSGMLHARTGMDLDAVSSQTQRLMNGSYHSCRKYHPAMGAYARASWGGDSQCGLPLICTRASLRYCLTDLRGDERISVFGV